MPRRKSTTPPPLNILSANRSPVDLLLNRPVTAPGGMVPPAPAAGPPIPPPVASRTRSSSDVCELEAMWQTLYDFYVAAAELWAPISADGDTLCRYRLQRDRLRATPLDRVELYRLDENPPPRY